MDLNPLNLAPNDVDWALAQAVRADFSIKPGAEHIASDFAMAHLSAFVRAIRPKTILEIGAGIGTITQLLLSHQARPAHLVSTEDNAYCLAQIGANISPTDQSHKLITDQKELDPEKDHFELVIIDASMQEHLYEIIGLGTYCFIEGSRSETREAIGRNLLSRGLTWDWKNFNRGTKWFRIARGFDVTGKPYRKIRLRKPIKGCWVGKVVALPG